MGRIFETRKHVMKARWDRMAKAFTRVAKDIAIAVKASGPLPENNPALRRVLQNARAVNMPKDKVQAAIDRACGKGALDWQEVVYEGYAPHGVAVIVEAATDNPTRTVANVRLHFSKGGGNLGSTGSVGFLFKRMGVFRLSPLAGGEREGGQGPPLAVEKVDQDSLELDLIDHGLEEMGESTNDKGEAEIVIRCTFAEFGRLQKAIEERGLTTISAQSEYVAQNPIELPKDHEAEVLELIDDLEQDEDVQRVFHSLA